MSTKPQLRRGAACKIFSCHTESRDGVSSWLYNPGTSSFEGGVTVGDFSWITFEWEYLYQFYCMELSSYTEVWCPPLLFSSINVIDPPWL